MTGHVRKRGERSYELKYEVGADPLTGKRRVRYASFKGTKKAAAIELARLIAEQAAGNGVDPTKATVAEFLATWLADWAKQNVSPLSFQHYEQMIRFYIVPRIGALPVQKLKPQHIQSLYAGLGRDGGKGRRPLSPRTVSNVHGLLKRALGHAQKWATISTNPAESVDAPSVPNSEVEILTEQQIAHFLNGSVGHELRSLFVFLLGTGARRSEGLALAWRDLDLDRGVVTIRASLEHVRPDKQMRRKEPKTRAGRRSVTLSPWLVAELRAHRARQQEQRLYLGMGRAPDDSPVFALWDGSWRTPNSASTAWSRLADELGFPEITLHALRHTHVSSLIAAGADVVTVSRRIGHANPTVTLSVYSHLFRNTDQVAADITEAMFRKAAGGNPGMRTDQPIDINECSKNCSLLR
jgi:integrase